MAVRDNLSCELDEHINGWAFKMLEMQTVNRFEQCWKVEITISTSSLAFYRTVSCSSIRKVQNTEYRIYYPTSFYCKNSHNFWLLLLQAKRKRTKILVAGPDWPDFFLKRKKSELRWSRCSNYNLTYLERCWWPKSTAGDSFQFSQICFEATVSMVSKRIQLNRVYTGNISDLQLPIQLWWRGFRSADLSLCAS